MTAIVIVGGSDAGISAALRIRELDPAAEVTLVVADRFPNYSVCGIPFFISREVPHWENLAHRTRADLEGQGLKLLLDSRAIRLSPDEGHVLVEGPQGPAVLGYDSLIVATGAVPVRPPIEGLETDGVFFIRSMDDCLLFDRWIDMKGAKSAIIVGGGYIGLEMADGLRLRGLDVTLIESGSTVLRTLDTDLGSLVGDELERHGVTIVPSSRIKAIRRDGESLVAADMANREHRADIVLVAVGAKPDVALARDAGAELGKKGALGVDRRMRTSLDRIFAAGDCVQTWHALKERFDYLPLGSTSHKQGRVAGENALGLSSEFMGTMGTQVIKIFDIVAARTGLREDEAREAGFDPFSEDLSAPDHKAYYPGAEPVAIRLTGDRGSGRLLGAQMVGKVSTQVAKRIDTFATALFYRARIADIAHLDLSYTPPLGSPWDVVHQAGMALERKRDL